MCEDIDCIREVSRRKNISVPKMSARGMLLKIDARRDSSLDQLDMMLSPRSPQILINDYFSPEGE